MRWSIVPEKPVLLLDVIHLAHVRLDEFSCKGVNRKPNNVTKEKSMDVLLSKQSGSGTNRGFRSMDNQVFTYCQEGVASTRSILEPIDRPSFIKTSTIVLQ
jgi:hypothetical protein